MTKVLIFTFKSADGQIMGEAWQEVSCQFNPLPYLLKFKDRPDGKNHPHRMEEKFASLRALNFILKGRVGEGAEIKFMETNKSILERTQGKEASNGN